MQLIDHKLARLADKLISRYDTLDKMYAEIHKIEEELYQIEEDYDNTISRHPAPSQEQLVYAYNVGVKDGVLEYVHKRND